MSDMGLKIWFWQRIVSPHMTGLAASLVRQGCSVTYVAEQVMSKDRMRQGWNPPDLGGARLELAPTIAVVAALVKAAPADSIHICQGIRGNGLVNTAQKALAQRGMRQWVVMETVEDSGWRGVLKRLEYRRLFTQWRSQIEGVLAIGHRTTDWVVARGVPAERVFPFAYFLPDEAAQLVEPQEKRTRFRFIFVGQFIQLKRLALLISALASLNRTEVELAVIGSGPLESELRAAAEAALPGRFIWRGQLPIHEVPPEIANADCLVLPSRYDGWGAVVSEALMVGTPVICSDRCGSAGVVQASGTGGVFAVDNREALAQLLADQLAHGPVTGGARRNVAGWATCFGATAGAAYLQEILDYTISGRGAQPVAPWLKKERLCLDLPQC